VRRPIDLDIRGRASRVAVVREQGHLTVTVDGRPWVVNAARVGPHMLSLLIEPGDGPPDARMAGPSGAGRPARTSYEVVVAPDRAGRFVVHVGAAAVPVVVHRARPTGRKDDDGLSAAGPQRVAAVMPGRVVRVLVRPGDTVRAGQGLAVVEAMKMENELRAGRDGRVTEVLVREATSVEAGTVLVVIE
jgi:biotin carboxyl carrier protein